MQSAPPLASIRILHLARIRPLIPSFPTAYSCLRVSHHLHRPFLLFQSPWRTLEVSFDDKAVLAFTWLWFTSLWTTRLGRIFHRYVNFLVLELLTIWKLTCWPILPVLCGRWRSQLFPCSGFSSSRWWCQAPQTKQTFLVNHDDSEDDYDDDEDDIWLDAQLLLRLDKSLEMILFCVVICCL